jgi:hypothetical protein
VHIAAPRVADRRSGVRHQSSIPPSPRRVKKGPMVTLGV